MRHRRPASLAILSALAFAGAIPPAALAQGSVDYAVTNSHFVIGDGGYDRLAFDGAGRRLYVSRTGGVDVFDASQPSPTLVATIPAFPSVLVNSIVLAPRYGIGFTSNNQGASTTEFVLGAPGLNAQFPLGETTDAAIFDTATGRAVFIGPDDDNALVYDLLRHRVEATIPLGAPPEYAVDDDDGHFYIGLDSLEVAEVDIAKRLVLAEHAINPACGAPLSLALDKADDLLFVGCASGLLTVMRAGSGATVASYQLGAVIDSVLYDPAQRTAFAAVVSGQLAGVGVLSSTEVRLLGSVPTAAGALNLAEDPRTRRLFTDYAVPGPPLTPGGRPSLLPNTFHVLTLSPTTR